MADDELSPHMREMLREDNEWFHAQMTSWRYRLLVRPYWFLWRHWHLAKFRLKRMRIIDG